MRKNYYVILGVTAGAGVEEIKAAYRRRALELHPDTSGMGSGPFLEVQEAYAVLVDPEQRESYDRKRRSLATATWRTWPKGEPLRPIKTARSLREVSFQ